MIQRGSGIWRQIQAGEMRIVLKKAWARLHGYRDISWGMLYPSTDANWIASYLQTHQRSSQPVCAHRHIDIIIVSYNGLKYLRECVASILAFTTCPDYRILIVDNASEPSVRNYLRDLAAVEKRIHIIFNASNLGFAAANNLGFRFSAERDFIVLLNNDTVVSPGWLCRLVEHAQQPGAGLVGPVTNWTGNEAKIPVPYHSVSDMPDFAEAFARAHAGQVFDIPMLAMYCIAMRRTVVEQVGLLDERFGIGLFEDEDYARRVRQVGLRILCAQDVFVHHYGMSSFGRLPSAQYYQLFEHNRQLFEAKWGESWSPHCI
jgi:GT2 family glycosyltransferase